MCNMVTMTVLILLITYIQIFDVDMEWEETFSGISTENGKYGFQQKASINNMLCQYILVDLKTAFISVRSYKWFRNWKYSSIDTHC